MSTSDPDDPCPNSIHGTMMAAAPAELQAAFRTMMAEITEEVETRTLGAQSRLAEFARNPEHRTVVYVSVTVIDEEARPRAYSVLYDQHGERMVRVLRFARETFERTRRLLMARDN